MNTELTINEERPKNALKALASRLNSDPAELVQTLKQGVFKGASDAEFQALVIISNEYQLNPIIKEMYAFPAKGGGIVPIVGIDGWFKIMNRQKNLNGHSCEIAEDGESATVTIHLKDRDHPVVVTEYLKECKRNSEPWNNMPKRMLRNRTYSQAIRIAFGVSGVFEEDEGIAFAEMRDANPKKKKTLIARDEPITPGKEQPAPRTERTVKPLEGKQKKERFTVDAEVISIEGPKATTQGKEYHLVTLQKSDHRSAQFTVFSSTLLGEIKGIPPGEFCCFTYTKDEKGRMTLESWDTLDALDATLNEEGIA